jgi:hypothetical protein
VVGRALEIGVGEDDHRVLAAELERHLGQRPRRPLHDLAPGGGRAGEVDEVDLIDERRAGVAAPGGDREDAHRHATLAQPVGQQKAGQRRDLAGLEDHRVARRQRRDAVAERVGQRVVPGPDDADEAERAIAQDELLALQQRRGGLDALVGQERRRVLGPEAERVGAVHDLGEQRVLVDLARL